MSEPKLYIKARTNYNATPPVSYKRDADYWEKDISNNLFYMSGNVGIGYAIPGSSLAVDGNVGIGTSIPLDTLDVSGGLLVRGNTNCVNIIATGNTNCINVIASGDISGTNIIASGNIGIGTNNPQAKLQVISGYIYAEPPITIIEDQKAVGTQGGSSSATTWNIRTLNTLVTNTIGVILSSNIFTVPPGRYHITISTPAYKVGRHKCRLYNVTTSSVSAYGTNAYILETINVQTDSNLEYVFTIATSTQFRIEHWTTVAQAANGLGVDFNQTPAVEVYTRVKLIKYA